MELPADVVKTLETKPKSDWYRVRVFRQSLLRGYWFYLRCYLDLTNTNEQFVSGDTFNTVVVAKNVSNPTDPAGLVGRALNVDIDVSQDSGKKDCLHLRHQ